MKKSDQSEKVIWLNNRKTFCSISRIIFGTHLRDQQFCRLSSTLLQLRRESHRAKFRRLPWEKKKGDLLYCSSVIFRIWQNCNSECCCYSKIDNYIIKWSMFVRETKSKKLSNRWKKLHERNMLIISKLHQEINEAWRLFKWYFFCTVLFLLWWVCV